MQIEEEELGFAPDKEGPMNELEANTESSQSEKDSDASDGELAGEDRRNLFSDILGAINSFS